MTDLVRASQSAAAGACALLADDDPDAAADLLWGFVVQECPDAGPIVVMQALTRALLHLAVHVSGRDPAPFREYALAVAALESEL